MAFIHVAPLRQQRNAAPTPSTVCAKASSSPAHPHPPIKHALIATLSVTAAALLFTHPVHAISLPSLPSLPSIDFSSSDKDEQTDRKDSSAKFTDEQEDKVDDMMAKLRAKRKEKVDTSTR